MARLTCALGPDAAGTVVTDLIRSATERLDVAVWELGPYYAWTTVRAAEAGCRVRVLLDRGPEANCGTFHTLANTGVAARGWSEPHAMAHWKLILADRATLGVGTGNLVRRDAPRDPLGRLPPDAAALRGTREWWVVAEGVPALVARGRHAFHLAWQQALAGPRLALVESPPDLPPIGAPQPEVPPLVTEVASRRLALTLGGAATAAALSAVMPVARRRVLVTVPYIHALAPRVRHLLADLTAATTRGVDCRVLLGLDPTTTDVTALPRELPVRVMSAERWTVGHAKGAIVDDRAFIGSANWSEAGLGANWEAGLTVRDDAVSDYYAAAFDRDWEAADVAVRDSRRPRLV